MKIYVMVGLPGSGKSTASRKINAIRVSHDDICRMLTGVTFRHELGDIYRQIEQAIAYILLGKGFSVVIDDNHLTESERQRWLESANDLGVDIEFVIMDTPYDQLRKWNLNEERLSASHFASDEVYEILQNRMTLPTDKYWFWNSASATN